MPLKSEAPDELWMAVADGDNDWVQKLLAADSSPHVTHQGWTPLMKAAENNRVDIMRLLIEHRADLEAESHGGRTALSFAAAPSNVREDNRRRPSAVDAVRLLLQQGAWVLQKDKSGKTAKGRALAENRQDAVELLTEAENTCRTRGVGDDVRREERERRKILGNASGASDGSAAKGRRGSARGVVRLGAGVVRRPPKTPQPKFPPCHRCRGCGQVQAHCTCYLRCGRCGERLNFCRCPSGQSSEQEDVVGTHETAQGKRDPLDVKGAQREDMMTEPCLVAFQKLYMEAREVRKPSPPAGPPPASLMMKKRRVLLDDVPWEA